MVGFERETTRKPAILAVTLFSDTHAAMGQNPVPPANIPIPTKIGSKMGGEFTYRPKWDPKTVLSPTAMSDFQGLLQAWLPLSRCPHPPVAQSGRSPTRFPE